jgi:hypothetical protein
VTLATCSIKLMARIAPAFPNAPIEGYVRGKVTVILPSKKPDC